MANDSVSVFAVYFHKFSFVFFSCSILKIQGNYGKRNLNFLINFLSCREIQSFRRID